jgi:myosin heavy subunit
LVAVNPCQDIDELYDEDTEAKYRKKSAVETRVMLFLK